MNTLSKNSISIIVALLLVIILSETKLFFFFTETYLGRSILILILLFASYLNKKLQTVQVNQCENEWQNIQYSNLTSITLFKQKYSLLNTTKDLLQYDDSINEKFVTRLYIDNYKNSKYLINNNYYVSKETPYTNYEVTFIDLKTMEEYYKDRQISERKLLLNKKLIKCIPNILIQKF
jgi:hypothetical protein